jgi:hypothetical protein
VLPLKPSENLYIFFIVSVLISIALFGSLLVSCIVSMCVLCDAFSFPTEKIESNKQTWP